MEHNNNEVAVLEKALAEGTDMLLRELNDLHLALVGGGAGETIL